MALQLIDLPLELLDQILSELDSARSLSDLSKTCKRLHSHIQIHAYRSFAKIRFPSFSIRPPPEESLSKAKIEYWKDAVHALTTQARNWDRRALLATRLDAFVPGNNAMQDFERQPTWQSMDFVPVIDSYQNWVGSKWASRKDVVAWGAGSLLVVRSRSSAIDVSRGNDSRSSVQHRDFLYRPIQFLEGRDDITALHLLPQMNHDYETCIIGRGSGHLAQVRLGYQATGGVETARYDTDGSAVRSSAHSREAGLLTACLGDKEVRLFDTKSACDGAQPRATGNVITENAEARTRTCAFLGSDRTAVGISQEKLSIHIYDLQCGFSGGPLRKLENAKLRTGAWTYAIAPLERSTGSSDTHGDLFLTGNQDGCVRYVHSCP